MLKIADFGIAKYFTDDSKVDDWSWGGTPAYMAPEQIDPTKFRTNNPRAADIYALGVILYEMLCGKPPFQGKDKAEICNKVIMEPAAPPQQRNRKVPDDLAAICLKCLEKSPDKRYSSAKELAEDIARYEQFEPVHAREPWSITYRTEKIVRKYPAGVVFVLLLLTSTVISVLFAVYATVKQHEARSAQLEAEESEHQTDSIRLNLLDILRYRKRADQFPPLLESMLTATKEKYGPFHLKTLEILDTLLCAYEFVDQFDKAEDILRSWLVESRNNLEPESSNTANLLWSLGYFLLKQRKFNEAEPILRKCLTDVEKKDPDGFGTFTTRAMLGYTLFLQKRYAKAEPLMREGYEGMLERRMKIPPSQELRCYFFLNQARERLVQLYEATGQKENLEKYQDDPGITPGIITPPPPDSENDDERPLPPEDDDIRRIPKSPAKSCPPLDRLIRKWKKVL